MHNDWRFMDNFDNLQGLKTDFIIFMKWLLGSVIDSGFLVGWVWVQHMSDVAIGNIQLSLIDETTLRIAQIIFAVATIAPIVLFLYKDIRVMAIRVSLVIKKESSMAINSMRDSDIKISSSDK